MKNYTLQDYIAIRRAILSQLRVWDKMSEQEKQNFKSATSEIRVDNLMVSLRRKYL